VTHEVIRTVLFTAGGLSLAAALSTVVFSVLGFLTRDRRHKVALRNLSFSGAMWAVMCACVSIGCMAAYLFIP